MQCAKNMNISGRARYRQPRSLCAHQPGAHLCRIIHLWIISVERCQRHHPSWASTLTVELPISCSEIFQEWAFLVVQPERSLHWEHVPGPCKGRDQLAGGIWGQGVAYSYGSAVDSRAPSIAHDLSHPAGGRIVLQYPPSILPHPSTSELK